MATYLLVNVIFIIAVIVALSRYIKKPSKSLYITLAALLVLTAVFDSMIVGFGMVAYDPSKILGIYIGNAPIEDFFYAMLAVILVPTLWRITKRRSASKQ